MFLPAANLFLISENRYPAPTSSISQLDRVLPSLVNCTTRGEGLLGPSDNWNLASKEPTPLDRKPGKYIIKMEYIES